MADGTVTTYMPTSDYMIDGCIMNGVSNLRHDVAANREVIKDVECAVRHDIKDAESQVRRDVKEAEGEVRRDIKMTESDLKGFLASNFCEIGKLVTRAEYESKLGTEKTIKEVNLNIDTKSDRLADKINHGFEEVTEQVSGLRNFAAEKFCEVEKQALELRIRKLEAELACCCKKGDK